MTNGYMVYCYYGPCKYRGNGDTCGRYRATSLDDYDIATIGPDGTCKNFSPAAQTEGRGAQTEGRDNG